MEEKLLSGYPSFQDQILESEFMKPLSESEIQKVGLSQESRMPKETRRKYYMKLTWNNSSKAILSDYFIHP